MLALAGLEEGAHSPRKQTSTDTTETGGMDDGTATRRRFRRLRGRFSWLFSLAKPAAIGQREEKERFWG